MANTPLRWQRALFASVIFGLCVVAVLLCIPSPPVRHYLTGVIAFACPLPALVWVLRGRSTLLIKRHRRAWGAFAASIACALIANLIWAISVVLDRERAMLPWVAFPFLAGYLFLWTGIAFRAEHYSPDASWRMALCCDLLVVTGAVTAITVYLAVPSMLRDPEITGGIRAALGAMPLLAFVTVIMLVVLLSSAVSRHLHKPRSLLVLGICIVLAGHACFIYLSATGAAHMAYLAYALGSLGFLLFGVAALWEAAFFRQRKQARAVDPFPALMAQLLPMVLLLTAAVLAIRSAYQAIPDSAALRTNLLFLGLIVMLSMVRQLVTFAGTRRLYVTLQKLYVEMARNAITDAITGLANHRYFMDRLGREMRRAARYHHSLTLVFADLDNFKHINDTYGHRVGDQALSAIADCLRKGVRDADMVARYGGEEFVMLLPETSLEDAAQMTERLRAAVEDLRIPLGHRGALRLTMSCGVSAYPATAVNLEHLLASADQAMYRAKESGRNRMCLAAPIRPESLEKSAVM